MDQISKELIEACEECFPGLRELIASKQMDKGWKMTREQELERRRVLQQQSAELQRLRKEAAGQMCLPIFGSGLAKKLAQSEIGSLSLKGMEIRK